MKKYSRIISEETSFQNKTCAGLYPTEPTLAQACNYPTCYPANAVPAKVGNDLYISYPSKRMPGYTAYLGRLGDGGMGSGTVKFSNDGGKTWLQQNNQEYVAQWRCSPLMKTIGETMNADQETWFQSLKASNPNVFKPYSELLGKAEATSGAYELVKLKDIPQLQGKLPQEAQVVDIFVWKYKGPVQQQDAMAPQKLIDDYFKAKLGYVDASEITPGEQSLYVPYNLKNHPTYGKSFTQDYIMYYDPTKISADAVKTNLDDAITKAKARNTKSDCRAAIQLYYEAYRLASTGALFATQEDIDQKKNVVRACKQHNFPFLKKKLDELENANPAKSTTGVQLDFALRQSKQSNLMRENKDIRLKSLIRESLLEIREEKKKTISEESKIVKGRIQFITEGTTFKTKKQKDNFCNNLLSEMIYFNSQGFDRQAINEGFFDILSGLFGNTGESILQYFKEYLAKWLITSLTPLDPNGWVGGTIVKAIGNLPIGDIPKLTDCNFTTKLLSKSIAEEAIDQLKQKAGLEGAFYDVLRNAVIESLEDTDLGGKIESALGSILCPMLSKVSGKMSDAADDMKKGALALP